MGYATEGGEAVASGFEGAVGGEGVGVGAETQGRLSGVALNHQVGNFAPSCAACLYLDNIYVVRQFPALVLSVCLLVGGLGAAYFKIVNVQRISILSTYSCGRMPNARKTGELILVGVVGDDNFFLFVSDEKKPQNEAVPFGELLYSSTQGSDSIFWAKDRMMFAEYSEATETFEHRSPWVRGYDWKTHQSLNPSQISWAFAAHGGKGEQGYPDSFKTVTPREIEMFHLTNVIR